MILLGIMEYSNDGFGFKNKIKTMLDFYLNINNIF